MFSRRQFFIGTCVACASIALPRSASAKALFEGVELGKAPGDYGYKHQQYHLYYQKVFGEIGQCACGYGDCRVTDWRQTKLGSPTGYDMIVNRHWIPLPETVWMPKPWQIPTALQQDRGHVCSYGAVGQELIPCAIIIVPTTT